MIPNLAYGDGRKIRYFVWDVGSLVSQSVQDSRIRDRWVREGPPSDARLVDVVVRKARNPAHILICMVIEHETFEAVPAGSEIPLQNVVMVDVQGAMAMFKPGTPLDEL